ncbi:DUF5703 domain-containing protein [Phocaeicola dorei]|uniref:DUF5703 domain-containing protein n=1 Tax=Phocaeicola dorei TaxID=357276 RepID=UPI0039B443E9
MSQYNVVWNSPSASALESMPCGGGDVGMNVWVEDGNLLIYLSRSGTFDELNTFPKLGRIRVSVSPNVLDDPDTFRQELRLEEGEVEIRSRKGSEEVTLRVWADVFRPMVHIDLEGNRQFTTYATYENWRSVTRNFAASLFRNIKYFTLRKLYLCRKWMQKRLQKTTTTGITLPNFDFLA